MTALNMTVEQALEHADDWTRGLTVHADSNGWGAILLVLAEEVRRLRMELAHEEQRVADMMADVNRVGHEYERLRADAARLDWLESTVLHFGDGYTEPREASIGWIGWTQGPEEPTFPGLRDAIDKAMEATNAG